MKRATRVNEAIARLQAVFVEVPGTRLSPAQAVMLAGLEPSMGESVLFALADARLLERDRKGLYRWHTDAPTVSDLAHTAHG